MTYPGQPPHEGSPAHGGQPYGGQPAYGEQPAYGGQPGHPSHAPSPGQPPAGGPPHGGGAPVCYRHPDRRAGVSCQRCSRPICPSCMVQASVGFHCVECVKSDPAKTYRARDLVTKPVVTFTLIGINAAIFLVGVATATSPQRAFESGSGSAFSDSLSLVGAELSRSGVLIGGVVRGEYWRLLTGGFLHAGILHLGMNMLSLYFIGRILEPALGRARFVALYTVSLFAGALGVMVLDPTQDTVGASGAIFGLMGVLFVLARKRGIDVWQSGIAQIIGLNLLITFSVPFISKGGHIGGLVGGALASFAMAEVEKRKANVRSAVAVCLGLSLLFIALSIVLANNWQHPLFG